MSDVCLYVVPYNASEQTALCVGACPFAARSGVRPERRRGRVRTCTVGEADLCCYSFWCD